MCPDGFHGSRCQQTLKRFLGNGWSWLKPLPSCNEYHISVEVMPSSDQGIIFYQGPLVLPEEGLRPSILLRLESGLPVLHVVLKSVEHVLKVGRNGDAGGSLVDGRWHRIDIFITQQFIQLILDKCAASNSSSHVGNKLNSCESTFHLESRAEVVGFGVDPLQVGGRYWSESSTHRGFDGCIRNLMFNDELYDFYVNPVVGMEMNARSDCSRNDEICNVGNRFKCPKSLCGSFSSGGSSCECHPSWGGKDCLIASSAIDFGEKSFLEWEFSDEVQETFASKFRHLTEIKLMFRTRNLSGMLLKVFNLHKSKYIALEVLNQRLTVTFNLNGWRGDLSLPHVNVSDGAWHTVWLTRERNWMEVKLDWSEGLYVNRTFSLETKVHAFVVAKTGAVAGGNIKMPSFTDTPFVESDFRNGNS